jgi:CRP/FNR family transcriptional regulator, anaerobic regulatory protein
MEHLWLRRMAAEKQVADFILRLPKNDRSGTPINIGMSRRDIADQLGLTVEIVCRVLTIFAKERVIAIPNVDQIEILDVEALEATAGH